MNKFLFNNLRFVVNKISYLRLNVTNCFLKKVQLPNQPGYISSNDFADLILSRYKGTTLPVYLHHAVYAWLEGRV